VPYEVGKGWMVRWGREGVGWDEVGKGSDGGFLPTSLTNEPHAGQYLCPPPCPRPCPPCPTVLPVLGRVPYEVAWIDQGSGPEAQARRVPTFYGAPRARPCQHTACFAASARCALRAACGKACGHSACGMPGLPLVRRGALRHAARVLRAPRVLGRYPRPAGRTGRCPMPRPARSCSMFGLLAANLPPPLAGSGGVVPARARAALALQPCEPHPRGDLEQRARVVPALLCCY
jgi:hypothetical protein